MPNSREQKICQAGQDFAHRVFMAESRYFLLGDDLRACYDATPDENLAAIQQRVREVEVLTDEAGVRGTGA